MCLASVPAVSLLAPKLAGGRSAVCFNDLFLLWLHFIVYSLSVVLRKLVFVFIWGMAPEFIDR